MTNNRMPLPLFELWLPAVENGILPIDRLTQWADDQIAKQETPPYWLLELSTAKDAEGVRKAMLSTALPDFDRQPGDHDRIYLGCLYFAYQFGRISLSQLLLKSGQYTDPRGAPDCETFYVLLNELEGTGITTTSPLPLKERVIRLFQPMVETLRRSFGVDESTHVEVMLPKLR